MYRTIQTINIMSNSYRPTAHSFHLCRYHIVFIPKYRKKILLPYQFILSDLIQTKLKDLQMDLLESSIQEDHIHLFIAARPDAQMSQVIGKLKSHLTSRLFDQCPDLLQICKTRNLWARGYFIATCGVDASVIENYIRNQ